MVGGCIGIWTLIIILIYMMRILSPSQYEMQVTTTVRNSNRRYRIYTICANPGVRQREHKYSSRSMLVDIQYVSKDRTRELDDCLYTVWKDIDSGKKYVEKFEKPQVPIFIEKEEARTPSTTSTCIMPVYHSPAHIHMGKNLTDEALYNSVSPVFL